MTKRSAVVTGVVCVCILILAAIVWRKPTRPVLPPDVAQASEAFKSQDAIGRGAYAELLAPHLKAGMSKQEIETLLGTADHGSTKERSSWSTGLSKAITVYYDEDGKALQVEGVGMEQLYKSGIERAWPFIRLGMTKTDVMVKLGGPQAQLDADKIWQYKPYYDPTVYTIHFDAEGKVKSLNPTREEFQRRMEERRQQRPKTPN